MAASVLSGVKRVGLNVEKLKEREKERGAGSRFVDRCVEPLGMYCSEVEDSCEISNRVKQREASVEIPSSCEFIIPSLSKFLELPCFPHLSSSLQLLFCSSSFDSRPMTDTLHYTRRSIGV